MTIQDFVMEHTVRGECSCGQCIDADHKPERYKIMEAKLPHTVDMVFFKVALKGEVTKEEFIQLTKEAPGEFASIDPFDGNIHTFIELGAWIGDQGLAMQYMALGVGLQVFELFSAKTVKPDISDEMAMKAAQAGLLGVKYKQVGG